MGEKLEQAKAAAGKAVDKVKDVVKDGVDKLVGVGETVAAGVAATIADEQDQKRENAEEFADRANAQLDRATAADAMGDYVRAVEGLVPAFKHLPDNEELELRFSDGFAFVDGARPVTRDRFKQDAFGVAYIDPVDFAVEGEVRRITEAWIVAGASAVRCDISPGLQIGGGHQAQLPAGHLIF